MQTLLIYVSSVFWRPLVTELQHLSNYFKTAAVMIKRRRNKKQFQVDHNELSFLSSNKPWKQQEKVVTALEVLDCLRHQMSTNLRQKEDDIF